MGFKENMLMIDNKDSEFHYEWYILKAIMLWGIWLDRNNTVFRSETPSPPEVIANKIWFEFESTIKSIVYKREKMKRWWEYRIELQAAPEEVAAKNIGNIEKEIKRLLRFIPANLPYDFPPLPEEETEDFIPLSVEIAPLPIPPQEKWRLRFTQTVSGANGV